MPDIGEIVGGIFDWLFSKILDFIITPFIDAVHNTFISEDAINNLQFVDIIYDSMRAAGLALLILITTWQAFKAIFAWMGLEADEPVKIALRSFVFGFLLFFSKDILMLGIEYTGKFANLILESMLSNNYDTDFVKMLGNGLLSAGTLFLLDVIIGIYVFFKSIGLFIRMFERLILAAMLIVFSPLAFACGVSQPTKGFFTGFIKVYAGNLLTQLVQVACIAALTITWISRGYGGTGNIAYYFITIAILKVSGKIEEIIREMSISSGIGRDFGGAMRNVSAVIHTSKTVMDIGRMLKK